ncbi:hypothetical protein, conserved [Babesia bigemina]|uniref:Uncharacterized protein n=1 Tax=Babesia bigemina TaxID=5866 RepID=A0A061DEN5_BABBI|nr:hypothetical protein, conserved [Babesia bigemina]CDR97590.1 hypothetical protein, conserved [Babesia bigemina]|eukprot:XP_012769776.1 hypothetical protein, conserved [Babesia bigemina]
MDKALADLSILWGKVGPFHDLSRILGPGASDPAAAYGKTWFAADSGSTHPLQATETEMDTVYERLMEDEMLQRASKLYQRWDTILFDADRQLDELSALQEKCVRSLNDLEMRRATYCLNFKNVNHKFNEMYNRKVALSDKLATLDEMYNHYANYKTFLRTVDQIENNQFFKTLGSMRVRNIKSAKTASGSKASDDNQAAAVIESTVSEEDALDMTLEYVEKVAERCNAMLPAIEASIDFFSIHVNYFDAEALKYRYEILRTRVCELMKLVFKEVYNFASESCKGFDHFDVAAHYNKYRRIGRSVRALSDYYAKQTTELGNSEFLQLQMYYITSRIKILNPLMLLKMDSFENFDSIAAFFLLICNLEVLTFKETFVTDEAHESLGTMVDNVVFYFTEACKRQMPKLQTSTDLRSAMASIQDKLITPVKTSGTKGVLQPLMLRAQQTYNNMESTLIKSVQREIATHVRAYDKKAFVKALCDEEQFEPDWEHELLSQLKDKNLRGANLYPPVCFAAGIVLKNVNYIGGYRLNKLASEALDAMKASIVDAQYLFGKMCQLDKALVRINQDFFMMRHLQHVFVLMDEFYGIDSLSSIYGLYDTAERQFCAGVAGLLLGDFQSFTRKQRKHDQPVYEEMLAAAMTQLTDKLPILKRRMEHQLGQKYFKRAFRKLKHSLEDVLTEYSKKFSFQPPTLPEEKESGEAEEPYHRLIRL